jgi:hypothetical protein
MDLFGRLDNGRMLNIEFQTRLRARPTRSAWRNASECTIWEARMRRDDDAQIDQIVFYLGKEPMRMRPKIESPSIQFQRKLAVEQLAILAGLRGLELELVKEARKYMPFVIDLMENRVYRNRYERGVADGRSEGALKVLRAQLKKRFGRLPLWAQKRLDEATATGRGLEPETPGRPEGRGRARQTLSAVAESKTPEKARSTFKLSVEPA